MMSVAGRVSIAVLLFSVGYSLIPPHLAVVPEYLPACKSGWKDDDKIGLIYGTYIPWQYVLRVGQDGHNTMKVLTREGKVVAFVEPGHERRFDCFDSDGKDEI